MSIPPSAASAPRDKEQRIAGEERRDDKAGLAEDDREQDRVNPDAVLLHHGRQMLVEVQDDIV